MKGLLRVLNEALSDEGKARMERLMRRMSDEDIDAIEKDFEVKSHAKRIFGDNDDFLKKNYIEFFEKHGLTTCNFSGSSAVETFLNIFKNNLKILNDYVNNVRKIGKTIDELYGSKGKNGNIYKLCKGWEKEAKQIAFLKPSSGSTSKGAFEVLVSFLLENGSLSNDGDVKVCDNGKCDFIEVKATKTDSSSGSHPTGQKGDIQFMHRYVGGEIAKFFGVKINGVPEFFNNNNGFDCLSGLYFDALESGKCTQDEFVRFLYDTTVTQFGNPGNVNDTAFADFNDLMKNAFTKNKIDKEIFIDALGCLQLFLYQKIEEFKYFLIFLYDGSYNMIDFSLNPRLQDLYDKVKFNFLNAKSNVSQGKSLQMFKRS